jgi:DNA-binding beta-propeller fold protein YncE
MTSIAFLAAALLGAGPGTIEALLVVNQPARTVQRVELPSGEVRFKAAMGERPHEIEVSPDRRTAVVPIYGSGAVGRPGSDGTGLELVDLDTGKVRQIPLGFGPLRPHDARFGPDGLLYVTAELRQAVLAIDPARWRAVAKIPTGRPQSHSRALSPDGRRAFTANVDSGSVSILDLRRRRLEGVVQAATMVQRITVSPSGRTIYTHDQRRPEVIAIDPQKRVVTRRYTLPGLPYVSASTADGRHLIVGGRPELEGAPSRTPSLYVLDLKSGQVATVLLPGWPRVILLDEAEQVAWTNLGSGEIVAISLRDRSVRFAARLERGLDGMAAMRSVAGSAK